MDKQKTLRKLQTGLPENWIVRFSTKYKDRVFYFNKATGKSSWTVPTDDDMSTKVKTKSKTKPATMAKLPSDSKIGNSTKGFSEAKTPQPIQSKTIPQKLVKSTLLHKRSKTINLPDARRLSFPITVSGISKQTGNKRKGNNLSSSLPLIPTKKPNFSDKETKKKSTAGNESPVGFTNPLNDATVVSNRSKLLSSKSKTRMQLNRRENNKQVSKSLPVDRANFPPVQAKILSENSHESPLKRTFPAKDERPNIQKNVSHDIEMADISMSNECAKESHADSPSPTNAVIFIVVDTNVFLQDNGLDDISDIVDWYPLPSDQFRRAIVVVPWVVLQELDALKSNSNTKLKARQAVAWLNRHFSAKKVGIRGQTIMEAATFIEGFSPENNDDRILQCCWFFQSLRGQHVTILYSHDTNLCNKALVSNFRTFSNIKALKDGVSKICKQINPEFDTHDQPDILTSKLKELSEVQEHDDLILNNVTSGTTLPEHVVADALSFALETEMEKAYGADMWKEVVLIKPPWSLIEVLRCMKKHWLAVFSMIGIDRLASVHIDQLIKSMTASPKKRTGAESRDKTFITSSIELLTALSSRVTPNDKIRQALKTLQARRKNLTNDKWDVESKLDRSTNQNTNAKKDMSPTADEAEVTSTTNTMEPTTSSVTGCENGAPVLVTADKGAFWAVLDQVWSSIVTHSVAILRSLPFVTSRALSKSPEELRKQMASPSSEQEIPTKEMSMHALPLLLGLMKGLQLSLERILLACSEEGAPPLVADCFDFLQSLWTTSQAFSLHTRVESLSPELVQQCVQSDSDKMQLRTGLEKLTSVHEVLEDCREMALKAL